MFFGKAIELVFGIETDIQDNNKIAIRNDIPNSKEITPDSFKKNYIIFTVFKVLIRLFF